MVGIAAALSRLDALDLTRHPPHHPDMNGLSGWWVRKVGFLGTLSTSDCPWAEGHAERLPTLAARERGAALP